MANALTALFPMFGHTQSDDVKAKKTAPTFQKNITDLLKSKDVVIADRYARLFYCSFAKTHPLTPFFCVQE